MKNLLLSLNDGKNNPRDPAMVYHNGYFYHCFALPNKLCVKKSKTLEGMLEAEIHEVCEIVDPKICKEIWAPELHIINDKCYIYVALDDGDNHNHRMYVFYNDSNDPLVKYQLKGKISDSTDKWAIDGTVIQYHDQLYYAWSGWEGDDNVAQNIYIAHMSDPFTIDSERVMISSPIYPWEKIGSTGQKESPFINEGPFGLIHNDQLYVVYSASGSWTDYYCLALLKFVGGDILDSKNWQKHPTPIFSKTDKVNGPGHASFITNAPDGKFYFAYHVFNTTCEKGWADTHAIVQEFYFDENDFPVLGEPVSYNVK